MRNLPSLSTFDQDEFMDRLARSAGEWGTAALRLLPVEMAHDVGLWLLERDALRFLPRPRFRSLAGLGMKVPGIGDLSHPLGLAAGFDKNCRAPFGFAKMGFSFLEVGTVTPLPQPGNPKPRMFRYPAQRALINRMGFNSEGSQVVAERLARLAWRHDDVPLGVNLGKNKLTPEELAIEDYLTGLETFRHLAQYFVVNISSPNTEGLRALASEEFLIHLAEREPGLLPKIWVKLDPDMPRQKFQALIATIAERGYQGVILSNTHKVAWPEPGGQSGHPLSVMSSASLERAYEVHGGKLPMIASGGVLTGVDVFEKIARGASAVQLYTALVYRGPWAVLTILEELKAELELRGMACLADALGCHYQGER